MIQSVNVAISRNRIRSHRDVGLGPDHMEQDSDGLFNSEENFGDCACSMEGDAKLLLNYVRRQKYIDDCVDEKTHVYVSFRPMSVIWSF